MLKRLMLIVCGALLIFVSMPLLRLDFSLSNYSTADIITILSPWAWIYLVLLPIVVLLISWFDKYLSWVIPFSFTIVFCVIFTLIQYPGIFYSDTFFHATTAKEIVNHGNFSLITGYLQYPGAFILLAAISEVLGFPLLETSILLTAFFVLTITLLLLIIGRVIMRRLNMNIEMSWVVPTTFLAFNFSFYIANHYSPQLIGLLMFTIFIYYCLRAPDFPQSREWTLSLLFLFAALTTIHVFSAEVTVACMFCIYFIGTRKLHLAKKHVSTLAIFMTVVLLFVSWHNFFAEENFRKVCTYLSSVLTGHRDIAFGRGIILNPLPGIYTRFFSIYRYGIYSIFALTSFLGLFVFRDRMESKLFVSLILGVFIGTIIIYLTPATFGVGRILHYGGVIVSILSLCALVRNDRRKRHIYFSKILTTVLPFLVVATFLISTAYYSTYILFIHLDEMKTANFVVENVLKQISVDVRSAHLIQFYSYTSIPMLFIDTRSDNSTIAQIKIQNSYLNIQYLPTQCYYFNLTFIENKANLIYSNGLGRVYAKAGLD